MKASIAELVLQSDAAISRLGLSPSSLRSYRWVWSRFEIFCSSQGVEELTDKVVASFLLTVIDDYRDGRIKAYRVCY
jgi:hypothetical protein